MFPSDHVYIVDRLLLTLVYGLVLRVARELHSRSRAPSSTMPTLTFIDRIYITFRDRALSIYPFTAIETIFPNTLLAVTFLQARSLKNLSSVPLLFFALLLPNSARQSPNLEERNKEKFFRGKIISRESFPIHNHRKLKKNSTSLFFPPYNFVE